MSAWVTRARELRGRYPGQFWLLFWGVLLVSSASSMFWPFLLIFVRQQLNLPMTTVALLLTVNSAAGLVGLAIAGPAADRFGRKPVMLVSLVGQGGAMVGMSLAASLPAWIAAMAFLGAFNPLYRVGADSMVADLLRAEERAGGYALLRVIANLGVAIGPLIGGFVTSVSYDIAFYASASASLIYAGLLSLRARETMPPRSTAPAAASGSYGPILRDKPFVQFIGVVALSGMAYVILMALLPVYAKENFGVVERQYGFILATNAAMVVLCQFAVTRWTSRRPALPVLALGSLFYAAGVGSVALGAGFGAFWMSMVILTVGELIMVPTSTTLTANLAPTEMRGRYMGLYSLTWTISVGLGPVLGGVLNDRLAPVAMWYGACLLALVSALMFLGLGRSSRLRTAGTAELSRLTG
ncbi:MAG: MFS protein [Anaerolineales bacterium]|nr:MFS protein [Anaerolineales bacterium]